MPSQVSNSQDLLAPAALIKGQAFANSAGWTEKESAWPARPLGFPHGKRRANSHRFLHRKAPFPLQLQVLVVDDSLGNRRLPELILNYEGHRILTVSNCREAVVSARKRNWDIILMDIQMPVMNGWLATEAIRSHERKLRELIPVPIVAVTDLTAPDIRTMPPIWNDCVPEQTNRISGANRYCESAGILWKACRDLE